MVDRRVDAVSNPMTDSVPAGVDETYTVSTNGETRCPNLHSLGEVQDTAPRMMNPMVA